MNYLWQLSVTVIKNYLWFLFLINDVNHLNILSWIICEVHQVFIVTFNIANYLWLFSWIICEWYSASYMSGTKNKCNCHHELSLCWTFNTNYSRLSLWIIYDQHHELSVIINDYQHELSVADNNCSCLYEIPSSLTLWIIIDYHCLISLTWKI